MKEHITAVTIANEVRMKRSQHPGSFLLVEGSKDARVYQRMVDSQSCRVVVCHNKDKALGALSILEAQKFGGVLTVVDADFWVLDGAPAGSNILLTDTHDLECLLLQSPALEKVLSEFGQAKKIEEWEARFGKTVRSALLYAGRPVGQLRWFSLRTGLALTFEGLPFEKLTSRDSLQLNELGMVSWVRARSNRLDLEAAELHHGARQLAGLAEDPWQVCCGHDLVCILSIALRKALGSKSSSEADPETVECLLRLAYEQVHFTATKLHAALLKWEAGNKPFRVVS